MAKRLPKKNYRVIVETTTRYYYSVEATSEEEAEEMIDRDDIEPYSDSYNDEITVEEE